MDEWLQRPFQSKHIGKMELNRKAIESKIIQAEVGKGH